MAKSAIFPGSFDPFTKGHEDIVRRGLPLFDKIYIAIGSNSKKQRYFDINNTIKSINAVFEKDDNVDVIVYDELTATLAKKLSVSYLLRGLRSTIDFEYEKSIAQINKDTNPELETVFLMTDPNLASIQSSILREIHKYNGDISTYLPAGYNID